MSRLRKVLKEADEIYGELKSSDWWCPHDDYLLIQAVERGYDSQKIFDTVKFSVPFSRREISNRWRELLYDEDVAKDVLPLVIKVSNVTSPRIPWRKNEDKIIKKELKEKGFLSYAHILHLNRKEFHCSRTVGSLESHYWSLKKRGKLDRIKIVKQKRGSTRNAIDFSPVKEVKSKGGRKKKKTKKSKDDEEDAFVFQGLKSGRTRKRGSGTKKKSKRTLSRRSTKIESIREMNKPPPDLSKIPNHAFAYLDGLNCRLFIEKKVSLIGKKTKVIIPDLDLSLEGNASKCVGRQAFLRFCKDMTPGGLNYYFEITNQSVKPLYVGDEKVGKDSSARVNHGQVLSFPGASIKFKFCEIHERLQTAKKMLFQSSSPSQSSIIPFMRGPVVPQKIQHPTQTQALFVPPPNVHPISQQGGLGPGLAGMNQLQLIPTRTFVINAPQSTNFRMLSQNPGVSVKPTPNMVVPKPPEQ